MQVYTTYTACIINLKSKQFCYLYTFIHSGLIVTKVTTNGSFSQQECGIFTALQGFSGDSRDHQGEIQLIFLPLGSTELLLRHDDLTCFQTFPDKEIPQPSFNGILQHLSSILRTFFPSFWPKSTLLTLNGQKRLFSIFLLSCFPLESQWIPLSSCYIQWNIIYSPYVDVSYLKLSLNHLLLCIQGEKPREVQSQLCYLK